MTELPPWVWWSTFWNTVWYSSCVLLCMFQFRDWFSLCSDYQSGSVHSASKKTQLPVFPTTKWCVSICSFKPNRFAKVLIDWLLYPVLCLEWRQISGANSDFCILLYNVIKKIEFPFYFLNISIINEPIFIILGTQNREEILSTWQWTYCPQYLSKSSVVAEMGDRARAKWVENWGRRYPFP